MPPCTHFGSKFLSYWELQWRQSPDILRWCHLAVCSGMRETDALFSKAQGWGIFYFLNWLRQNNVKEHAKNETNNHNLNWLINAIFVILLWWYASALLKPFIRSGFPQTWTRLGTLHFWRKNKASVNVILMLERRVLSNITTLVHKCQ